MHVGAVFSQADSGTDAAAIREWAIAADEAGLHHLLAYDHVLGAPVDRLGVDACPPFPEPPYTDESTFHEALTLFAHLAGVTTRIEFATSVVVAPQRQTALLAKQIATVDRLSGGRLNVAVGAGWNHAEYQGMGVDFADRGAILGEQVELLRRLWSEPLVTFEGRFHTLDRVGINPLPDRDIPIWIGTQATDAALRRVVELADGWMPLVLPGIDSWDLGDRVRRLRELCERADRDPADVPVWGRHYLDGSDTWRPAAEQAAELGFSHFSLGYHRFAAPPTDHRGHLDAVIGVLDDVRSIAG
jgi:probable F420-dependent oxidoreductase